MPEITHIKQPTLADCAPELEAIPTFCKTGPREDMGVPVPGWFEKCQIPINTADQCIKNKVKLTCHGDLAKYFVPYYLLATRVNEQLKNLNPFDSIKIASAIRDIYFASISKCEPKLIDTAWRVLGSAIMNNKFGEFPSFISKTSIKDLTDVVGITFGNKEATLLLVKIFMTDSPGKTNQEYLKKAFEYFPPAPLVIKP